MMAISLSESWRAVGPTVGNHLWQSTLFVAGAGLLTLLMRQQRARVRYWIWLAASVKFLIPFSLLIDLGSRLSWYRASTPANTGMYFAMEAISQPFLHPTVQVTSGPSTSIALPALPHLLPSLAALWLCGCVVVLFRWSVRWRRISVAVRSGVPLREGREVEAMRKLKQVTGRGRGIEMLSSRSSLEPGIFGIARPVLIWPEGISQHLDDAHLEAILAHELWHVRRRDNLAAAMHMAVEAVFWFHPLVWWLGARLVEERERACDEEVLDLGGEPKIYAESILKVCEFCVGSPLACVSGVTGADLKKRMVDIMTERVARKLDLGRRILLSAAVFVALAVPIGFGVMNATQGRAQAQTGSSEASPTAYKSASVSQHLSGSGGNDRVGVFFSPHGFTARGATLESVIGVAYGVQPDLISGVPDWVKSEKYDIDVTLPDSSVEDVPKPGAGIGIEKLRPMLQALLAERFHLTLHRQTRDVQVYELAVAEGGPKLQEASPQYMNPNGINGPEGRLPKRGLMKMGPGELTDQDTNLEHFSEQLSWQLGRTVVDKTGLTGTYNFSLRWTPGESEAGMMKLTGVKPDAGDGPLIFTAIQEQLGLKLETKTSPMSIVVIDRVERPAEN